MYIISGVICVCACVCVCVEGGRVSREGGGVEGGVGRCGCVTVTASMTI